MWSHLLESSRDERESKGERFDVPATFLRISATPETDSFDSGIHLDPLVELYIYDVGNNGFEPK